VAGIGEHFGAKLNHRDIMGLARRRITEDLRSDRSREVIEALAHEVDTHQSRQAK
jgi:hypothetical protein